MMNTPNKNHRHRLPQWQAEKMRTLIEERWSEVWEVVIARERSTQNSPRKRNSRHNSDFLRN